MNSPSEDYIVLSWLINRMNN